MEMTLVGCEGLASRTASRQVPGETHNVGRHITTLGLNDGQGSERSAAVALTHLGGTLE
jgi:hypothetical protein